MSHFQGFWEMIHFQVEQVDEGFAALRKLESNAWLASEQEEKKEPEEKKKPKKLQPAKRKKPAASSGLRAMMAAKRKEMKTGGAQPEGESNPTLLSAMPERVFEEGFFSVRSPLREKNSGERSGKGTPHPGKASEEGNGRSLRSSSAATTLAFD